MCTIQLPLFYLHASNEASRNTGSVPQSDKTSYHKTFADKRTMPTNATMITYTLIFNVHLDIQTYQCSVNTGPHTCASKNFNVQYFWRNKKGGQTRLLMNKL